MTCFSLSDAAHYTHYLKALSASVFARALYLSTCHLNGKALVTDQPMCIPWEGQVSL